MSAAPVRVAFRYSASKSVRGHIYLTTHFQDARHSALQDERNLVDGADILSHIFSGFAVTASGGLN